MRVASQIALVALTLSSAYAQRNLRTNKQVRELDSPQDAAKAAHPDGFMLEETITLMGKQVKGAVSSSGWYFAPGSGAGQGGDGNKDAAKMFQLDESLKVENDQGVTATVNTTQLFYPPGVNKEHDGQEGILVKETLLLQKGDASKAVSSSGWYYTGGAGGGDRGDGNKDLALHETLDVGGQQIDAAVASSGWYYTGGSGGGDRGDGNKVEIDESVTIGKKSMKGAVSASGWYFSGEGEEHADSGKHKLELDESMAMEEDGIKAAVSSSGWYFAPGQGGGSGDGGR